MGLAKFNTQNPHILEFDMDPTDRGFTQNMVGGQIVIPSMFKITGEEDTNNSDVVVDDVELEVDDVEFENEDSIGFWNILGADTGLGGFS